MNYFLYHNDWKASRRIINVILAGTDGAPATGEANNKVKLLKNGAAGDAGADSSAGLTALDAARGSYEVQLGQTEYDLGRLRVSYHKSGLLPFIRTYFVEPCPDVWMGVCGGGGSNYADLDVDPVAAYGTRVERGMILQLSRLTGSPADAVVLSYSAATKRVVVDASWGTPPDNTTHGRLLRGPLPPPSMDANIALIGGNADAAETMAKMARGGAAGVVVAGTVTRTSVPTDLTSLDADHYAGGTMIFIDGNLADQRRPISANTVAGLFTIEDWQGGGTGFTRAPAVGDHFVVV